MVKEINVMPEFERGVIRVGGEIPKFRYEGTIRGEIEAGRLTKDLAIDLLKCMLMIRNVEDMLVELRVHKGKYGSLRFLYRGPTHLSIGQEAMSTGAISAITLNDYITSHHRGHGDVVAKGYFALREMTEEQLVNYLKKNERIMNYLKLKVEKGNRDALFEAALRVHLFKIIAELFGKEDGYCRGRGGSMHIACFDLNHLGATAIVGGCVAMAVGSGIASRYLGDDRVTLCFAGDGAYNNGVVQEALNMACMAQFTNGLMGRRYGIPTIFIIVNNQYGMSGQQKGEVTGIDYLAERGFAYNKIGMHAEIVNGMDVLAVRDATLRAVELARKGEGPILLEFVGYRFKGHSLSDREYYRTKEEVEAWMRWDPIKVYSERLLKEGILTKEELDRLVKEARLRNEEVARVAAEAPDPDPKEVCAYTFSEEVEEEVPEEFRNAPVLKEPELVNRDPNVEITYREALLEAFYQAMKNDKRIVFWGEDIADYGGAFGATKGLLEMFGRERIFNTAISEAAIVGAGLGAALRGLKPVVEIMYIDFITQALDQLGNHAAKWCYMTGGQVSVPLIVRTTIGGGRGYAGQHSQSLESLLLHFPGLKVVYPSNAYDVKGMFMASLRDKNPIVFIEHQNFHRDPVYSKLTKRKVPKEEYIVPLGKAAVVRKAANYDNAVTIITWSYLVYDSLSAAEKLAKEGIEAEVIDLRTLYPLDMETVLESVRKTHRAVVVHQAISFMSLGAEIAAQIQEKALDYLDAPILRVTAPYCTPPSSAVLEREFLPNEEDILETVRKLF